MIQASERSPRCRWLFVTLILITLATISAATLTWIGQVRESAHRAREASTEVARLAALAQQRPLLREQLSDFDRQLRTSRYLLSASSSAQVAAELVTHLKRSLSTHSSLVEVKFLPSHSRANILRVGIRAHVRGDEHALLRLLYRNEQAQPLLHIENLHVRTLDSARQDPARQTRGPLDIHFDLIGYMLQR
jgi:uncharacterized membrane protein